LANDVAKVRMVLSVEGQDHAIASKAKHMSFQSRQGMVDTAALVTMQ
jgi:hypothetical protein